MAVQQLKQEPGKGLFVSGVKLALALTGLGLIDEYEVVVHARLAGVPAPARVPALKQTSSGKGNVS